MTHQPSEPIFHPAQERFELAIKSGCLSESPGHANFAAEFMYMGTWDGVDLFKHRLTRKYLRHACQSKAVQS